MKLSNYTGLVIGPLMIGVGGFLGVATLNGNETLNTNREFALALAGIFGMYGLIRLVRSVRSLNQDRKQ